MCLCYVHNTLSLYGTHAMTYNVHAYSELYLYTYTYVHVSEYYTVSARAKRASIRKSRLNERNIPLMSISDPVM